MIIAPSRLVIYFLLIAILFLTNCQQEQGMAIPSALAVNGNAEKELIIQGNPRFSWDVVQGQAFWQIRVARLPELLEREKGDLWDSGKQAFIELPISYQGIKLHHGQKYYWHLRVWDSLGNDASYSAIHSFELIPTDSLFNAIALLPIQCKEADADKMILEKSFFLEKEVRASRIYIAHSYPIDLRLKDSIIALYTLPFRGSNVSVATLTPYLRWGENKLQICSRDGDTISSLLQLSFTDGSEYKILSDSSWISASPCLPSSSTE